MIGEKIETHVCGIPCLAEVTYFVSVEPWNGPAHTCPSSDDYYGYTEIEYEILDRKGYRARWLENKVTKKDDSKIREDITTYFKNREH